MKKLFHIHFLQYILSTRLVYLSGMGTINAMMCANFSFTKIENFFSIIIKNKCKKKLQILENVQSSIIKYADEKWITGVK